MLTIAPGNFDTELAPKSIALGSASLQNGRLDRGVPDERKWAEAVRDKLIAKAKTMSPIAKRPLSFFIDCFIVPALS